MKNFLDELDAFDTAQSIDAWDEANDIEDNELTSYLDAAAKQIEEDYSGELLFENPIFDFVKPTTNIVYSGILKKMIDVNTGLPVEE